MSLDVRSLAPDEVPAAWAVVETAFGSSGSAEVAAVEMSIVDPSRFYAVHDDVRPVATAGSCALSLTVPGAVVPVAGVTWVAVLPTSRRQGVLTSLMERQLSDLHDSGTAVAALWASEGGIYGRYGYGPAAWSVSVTVPRGAAFRTPVLPGGVRLVEPAPAHLAPVYDAAAERTPGFPRRDETWWAFRLHDPESSRGGLSPLQCVVTEGGYALYAVEEHWADGLPAGRVHVRELVVVDEGARGRLWRYLLDLDLTQEVRARLVAPDDPLLLSVLAEPRRARATLRDNLWVRLVDVREALRSRRYACDVDVVVELDDPRARWNSGRWRVTGDRSGAACVRTKAAADLTLGVDDLAASYLGGTPLRSRPVQEHTPGALDAASTAFGPLGAAPWCPQVF